MSEQFAEQAVRVLSMNATLPVLRIPWPQCGHCGEDVTIEDGMAWCDECLVEWGRIEDGAAGSPDQGRDGTDVPCGIVVGKQDEPHDDKCGKHYVPGPPKPCILPSGHRGNHTCPYDVEVTTPPAPPAQDGA